MLHKFRGIKLSHCLKINDKFQLHSEMPFKIVFSEIEFCERNTYYSVSTICAKVIYRFKVKEKKRN